MDLDLVDCLTRIRQQDESAARALIDHLHPFVQKIVRANLPRRADVEDLMQDIFVKIFSHLDQFRGGVPFEHWVSRIAVNHCINALRAQRSRPEWRMADLSEDHAEVVEAIATNPDRDPHPGEALGARELLERLLEQLSPRERMLIQLLEIEDRTIEEVRQLTGWSAVSVRVSVFRARQKLNRLYKEMKEQRKL
jgi:RNA polymerase sigma-70 factor (ECF subfamily)